MREQKDLRAAHIPGIRRYLRRSGGVQRATTCRISSLPAVDHTMASRRARLVAEACAARRMDRHLLSLDLAESGLERTEGDVAIELVVTAFGWAILRRMGVNNFPSVFVIDQPAGEQVELKVAEAHLFTAALGLAVDLFENGYTASLSKDGVAAIIAASAEVGAVSKALNDNPSTDLAKSSLRTSFYGFDATEFKIAAGYQV